MKLFLSQPRRFTFPVQFSYPLGPEAIVSKQLCGVVGQLGLNHSSYTLWKLVNARRVSHSDCAWIFSSKYEQTSAVEKKLVWHPNTKKLVVVAMIK